MKRLFNLLAIVLVLAQLFTSTATQIAQAAPSASILVWSPLGDGLYSVSALTVDASHNLYAGGDFLYSDQKEVNYIAKWNGSSWSTLGSGMDFDVTALAFDNNGNLYAGGGFTAASGTRANRVAKWDGNNWSALGSGVDAGDNGTWVSSMVVDGNGNLYVAGNFHTAGGATANYIAKWDGKNWSALGNGMNGQVDALALDGNGNLYAGGDFTMAGGATVGYVARWDGSAWSALGTGMSAEGRVLSLATDESGNLYAGGYFAMAGATTVRNIAKWNGVTWSALGLGTSNTVTSIIFDGSGNLIAAGYFMTAGGTAVDHVAKWNGAAWSALGLGLEAALHDAPHSLAKDGKGNLYADSFILSAVPPAVTGTTPTDGAHLNPGPKTMSVVFNGDVLHDGSLHAANLPANYLLISDKDNGFQTISCAAGVNALDRSYPVNNVTYNPDNFTASLSVNAGVALPMGRYRLLVCQAIQDHDGTSLVADRVVSFLVGGHWSALGAGMNGMVETLAADGKGNVYAGGNFTLAGGKSANYVAQWNGASWSALGAGAKYNVSALVVDASGNLYAAGIFVIAGQAHEGVSKWDGAAWSAVGGEMNDSVAALAFDGSGNLYAGGYFTKVGSVTVNFVAKWDGHSWSALGNGLDGASDNDVYTLTTDTDGKVFAGGHFTMDGHHSQPIVRWDGSSWSSVGLIGVAFALISDRNGNVYGTGGSFSTPTDDFYITEASLGGRFEGVPGTHNAEMTGGASALAADGSGSLYAGGWFTKIGGQSINRIAMWDGSSWTALESGVNNDGVSALTLDSHGDLYAGGDFTSAGGQKANYIAKWSPDNSATYAPVPLTPVNQAKLAYNRPVFDWQDVSDAKGYIIQIARDMGFTKLVVNTQVTASAFIPASSLPAGVSLYWRVRRNTTLGPNPWSAIWSLKTARPPSIPSLLSPADNFLTKDYTPTLTWRPSNLFSGTTFQKYELQLSKSSDFTSLTDIKIIGSTANSHYTPAKDLVSNTKYYWRVRAYNTLGQRSDWSQIRSFRTAILAPVLTAPINGKSTADHAPTFTWLALSGTNGYTIRISRNRTFTTFVVNTNVSATSFTPLNNLPSGTYYWRVRANGAHGPGLWSAIWSVVIH